MYRDGRKISICTKMSWTEIKVITANVLKYVKTHICVNI